MLLLFPIPYYAVIFTSELNEVDEDYHKYNEILEIEAKNYAGYLGIESARNGLGISVSYWKSTDDILLWRKNTNHQIAQNLV